MKKTNAFIHAAGGIRHAFTNEPNFRIHVLATTIVIIMGLTLHVTVIDWLFIAGCCMLVLSLELVNTAVENICNLISKEYDPLIKVIKDVSAAAVLVSALGSIVTACIIFLPKIIHQIKHFL